uniref:Uncharacterized protein n=2 Tax=Canis lupus familiaris TaxID=9615 RepID=A0A8C0SW39_CANLF
MCHRKAVVKNAHMPEKMQWDSVERTTQVLEKNIIERRPLGPALRRFFL